MCVCVCWGRVAQDHLTQFSLHSQQIMARGQILPLPIANQILLSTAMPIYLCIVSGCFCSTTSELNSWDRGLLDKIKIEYLLFGPLQKCLPVTLLEGTVFEMHISLALRWTFQSLQSICVHNKYLLQSYFSCCYYFLHVPCCEKPSLRAWFRL